MRCTGKLVLPGLAMLFCSGCTWLIPEETPEWKRQIEARLRTPVNFGELEDIKDLCDYLRALKRVDFVLDPPALRKAEWKPVAATDGRKRVDVVLDRVCRLYGLAWAIMDEAVVITTPQRLEAWRRQPTMVYDREAFRPFEERLKRRVSFCFVATPLEDCVAFFRNLMNVSIVVNKQALEGRPDTDLTLRLDTEEVSFRSALMWTCRMLDLGWTVRNGAIYISTHGPDLVPNTKGKPGR